MTRLTRRRFVALTAAGAAAPFAPAGTHAIAQLPGARPTAQAIVDRIKTGIGVPWRDDTSDTWLAGQPSTRVTGIVTTSMATLEVLRQAVTSGANVVITAAPAFYAPPDRSTPPADDPVYAGKRAFIEQRGLVIFRLAQHWHLRTPDPRALGLASLMGWTGRALGDDGLRYEVDARSLETLARELTKGLAIRGSLRAIGDRALPVRRIGLLPGVSRIEAAIAMLPTVDVVVAGEVWEWEAAAYVRDVVYARLPKGFISIGRVVNEAPGMQVCADWLTTLVPEVPVRYISAGDPYWRPR